MAVFRFEFSFYGDYVSWSSVHPYLYKQEDEIFLDKGYQHRRHSAVPTQQSKQPNTAQKFMPHASAMIKNPANTKPSPIKIFLFRGCFRLRMTPPPRCSYNSVFGSGLSCYAFQDISRALIRSTQPWATST